MKYSVIVEDSRVVAGGVGRVVDMTGLIPDGVWAIQWDSEAKAGHIEYSDGRPNLAITSLDEFDGLVAAWQAAAPIPEIPPTDTEIDDASLATLSKAGSIEMALGEALFRVGNDVRVLKGQGTITKAQFVTYLRGLLR